jgi:hypothetical protein
VESVFAFNRGCKYHRAAMVTPTLVEPDWRQDGGEGNNRMRGQWEFINK